MPIFVSFNANSIRKRLHQLQAIKDTLNPDIIALQETKVQDEAFPWAQIEALGYHAQFFGQKTHYGVALLAKSPPIFVQKGLLGDDESSQRRFIHGRFVCAGQEIDVLNGYFPQGESFHHPTKYPMKRRFYADVTAYVARLLSDGRKLVLMGDMNIAPQAGDVGIGAAAAKRWLQQGVCSFLPEERAWYETLLAAGLIDSYRALYPAGGELSWFDYRNKGFDDTPKRGLRIDHILLSHNLGAALAGAGIDYVTRAMEQPSDHAPIWAKLDFSAV